MGGSNEDEGHYVKVAENVTSGGKGKEKEADGSQIRSLSSRLI